MSEAPYNTGITDDQIRAINARAMQAVDRDAELETLRDERDRLRKALEDIRDSIGNGALNVNWIKQYAEAALTPAAKGGDDD